MFELKKQYTFFWPVKVMVPVDGEHRPATFDAEFRMPAEDEIAELARGAIDDRTFLARNLIGWRGIQHGGEDWPFTEENRDAVCGDPTVKTALFAAFWDAIHGGAKAKN